jgi:exopolyphosphatase/guanosine-5'-triphosphate,3'-diphosphate pyrophosphatase
VSPAAVTGAPPRVAALDCGTNSTRLLILNGDGSTHVRHMRITRLGQGVDATGLLAPEAIDRTVNVLDQYRHLMDQADVGAARLIATSAVRDSHNGNDFLQAAEATTGLPAELISGEEEGQLAYAGATLGLEPVPGDNVVVDIGGGSTELVVGRAGHVAACSLRVGCVRVTERYLGHDPPTAEEIDAAESYISSTVSEGVASLPSLSSLVPGSRLIGLAGTVTTLMALDLGLGEYDPLKTHHAWLRCQAVDHWCKVLATETSAQRARRSAIVEGRRDVIVGGALILRRVMDVLGFEQGLVSETDILDGLALSVLRRTDR